MCFVLEWRTGLWARETALRLSQNIWGTLLFTCSFWSKDCIQMISAEACARLLYSASALDRATSVCFLAHQDTKLWPKNMHAPDALLLSSGAEAQSASQNPVIGSGSVVLAGLRSKPWCRVPCKYLRILFTAFQWSSWGADRNWHTLFTEKEISGLVIVAYCRAPTIDLKYEDQKHCWSQTLITWW